LYDIDGDGVISEGDLRKLLEMLVGKTMSPSTIDAVIAVTLAEADKDRDGRISYEDFEQVGVPSANGMHASLQFLSPAPASAIMMKPEPPFRLCCHHGS
jgi:serine/threonine-protein phosphatase 2B regulatory subunit